MWINTGIDGKLALLIVTIFLFIIIMNHLIEKKHKEHPESYKKINYLPILILALLLIVFQVMMLLISGGSFSFIVIIGIWLYAIMPVINAFKKIFGKEGNDSNEEL